MLIYERPEAVKRKAEQLKQSGENIYIQPLEFRLFGGTFFWIRYYKKEENWYLIVDKEGNVPPRDKKVDDLLIAGLSVGSAYNDLNFNEKMSKKKDDIRFKKYLPLLQKVKEFITVQNPVLLDDFSQFEKLIHTTIELQPKMRQGFKEMERLGKFFHRNRYITDELYDEFRKIHYATVKYGFLPGYEQVKSYPARKKVISYLFRCGKISWAIKLWFLHIQLQSDNLDPEQQKGFDQMYQIFIEGKRGEVEEYMLRHCRNPE
ncbi:hypothetical protein ACFQ5F_09005 [Kroppenstedtia eburnea]|uniref:hypothetical protein n=1 Tax=Kroppenstedtia eburnea TaxID=714067 RepID=UPI0036307A02